MLLWMPGKPLGTGTEPGVVAMGNGLMGELETRLLRGKAALSYDDAEQSSVSAETVQRTPRQAKPEFFLHRRYRLPQRPDVEIDRRVWLSAAEGKT